MLDAGFLIAEDSDRNVSLAIGGIAVIDGCAPDDQEFKNLVAERIRAIPRSTQLLRTQPFDVGAPRWADDPNFDLARHVRRVALPRLGDDSELFRIVAHVLERRLDKDRPLWECWVIEGLSGGRWAILLKIHHRMADGISATRIVSGLCDAVDGDVVARPVAAKRTAARHLQPVPEPAARANPLATLWRTAAAVTDAAARTVNGVAGIAAELIRPVTGSVGPVTSMRHYRAMRVPLADVVQICRKFDVTVNDVALAAITEGFRSVLLSRGQEPRADSLRTLVPVSERAPGGPDTVGNKISVMLPYLPVEQPDPIQQLRAVHSRLTRTKHGGQREAGPMVTSAANHLPFMMPSWAVRVLTRLPQRGIVTLATNVPGPRRRLTMTGRKVLQLLPIPPIALRLRTGVAVLSYADDLVFGVTADYDSALDVEELAGGIERAVARLVALSHDPILLFAR